MLSFAADIPPLADITIDGNVDDWKQEAKERGAIVKLPGNAQLRSGWNEQGLLLLLRLPKGFDGGSGSTMGAVAILIGQSGSKTMHQLTVDAIEGKYQVRGWDGEKNIDASINAEGDSAEGMTVEAIVPWASLGVSRELGATLNVAIRYFDPRESYFTERRMAPFDSARERAGEFRANRGLTFRLSSATSDAIVETEARRNHYGYLAYDLVMRAADRLVWNGDWTAKVRTSEDAFHAELAIPWKTLEEAGIQRERLQLDLNKPLNAADAQDRMLPLLNRQSVIVHTAEQPETADYVVRLHFAELDDVEAGQRVFDVVLQGQVVLENLDVVHEAGGRYHALVKEFSNIRAGRSMELQLVPKTDKLDATTTPILNGLEIHQVPTQ
jgi:hypothetical protein